METKIIQITAGRGPEECAWVVAKILKYFIKELALQNISYSVLKKENGIENGTIQSVSVELKGKDLALFLKDWLGTIQWIGISTFRKFHKRKNWFIGCFEIEQKDKVSISVKDVKYQAIRSSGPGGQHVNKVSSAIRAIHLPTKLQVLVMDSRSQHQNKKIAQLRLLEKLEVYNREQSKKSIEGLWENHLNLERGNPVQVFKGTNFKKEKKQKSFKKNRNDLKKDLRKQLE
jgi:peptide chain release factor